MNVSIYPLVEKRTLSTTTFLGRSDVEAWGLSAGGSYMVVPADVIVIPRTDLPEVRTSPGGGYPTITDDLPETVSAVQVSRGEFTAANARQMARAYLAIAEHLDAHPSVDEAQVEALTAMIRGTISTRDEYDAAPHIARRLVQQGVTVAEVRP